MEDLVPAGFLSSLLSAPKRVSFVLFQCKQIHIHIFYPVKSSFLFNMCWILQVFLGVVGPNICGSPKFHAQDTGAVIAALNQLAQDIVSWHHQCPYFFANRAWCAQKTTGRMWENVVKYPNMEIFLGIFQS